MFLSADGTILRDSADTNETIDTFVRRDPCGSVQTCDVNCDTYVDNGDIDAFVLALSDPEDYRGEYPNCDLMCSADINGDGAVDNADLDPFIDCLAE